MPNTGSVTEGEKVKVAGEVGEKSTRKKSVRAPCWLGEKVRDCWLEVVGVPGVIQGDPFSTTCCSLIA